MMARPEVIDCIFRGAIKEHRQMHGIGRNDTATRANMRGRTLSYVEDGAVTATPQIVDRIHAAIDALAVGQKREAG